MIKRLLDYTEPAYHRPNDNWIDVPVTLITEDGEVKTITVRKRSLRAKRRIFTQSVTAFTIGLLMILLSSPYSSEFITPGPLSSNHGQIMAGENADSCAACHAAANGSVAGWIASTISMGKSAGLTQSELCMKCHDKSLNVDAATNPHNIAPDELAKTTSKYHSVSFDAGMIFRPPVEDHNIACSACHQEHHGSKADLTAMTDQQCQTCHTESFHSFETGHPEFTSYPLHRRSRIAFDHSSHSSQHFPSKQTDFNCNQCHIDDSFQNVKQLASYDQACATCHHQQVLESGRDGLALIALPMLDTDAIETANLKIGSWPLAATGDFDGALPPIMRVMLTADPAAAGILDRFGPHFDFADIDPANPSDVEDAVELVWAIKRLLYDLSLDGPRAIRTRLESVMRLEVSDAELQKMVTNLDEPVFQNAVRRWLPNLIVEITNHRFKDPKVAKQTGTVLEDIALKQSSLSWWPSDNELLMRIANQDDLLATNPLKGLIQSKAESETPAPLSIVRIPAKQARFDRAPQKPVEMPLPPSQNVRLENVHADPLSDPMLLAINPLHALQNPNPTTSPTGLPIVKIPRPPQPGLVHANTVSNPPSNSTSKPSLDSNVAVKTDKFVKIQPPPVVVPSGWFRNDALFQIRYQPSGHADQCIQSWIELVARAADADTRAETTQLFDKTLSLSSIGMCRTCHTVDQKSDRSFEVNWNADYRDASVRSFTRFSHGPHLIQPNLQNCSHCHSLDPASRNHESFHGVDASEMVSNFLPMTKSNCTSCHSAKQTNGGCTQCHSYHVGSRVTGGK